MQIESKLGLLTNSEFLIEKKKIYYIDIKFFLLNN